MNYKVKLIKDGKVDVMTLETEESIDAVAIRMAKSIDYPDPSEILDCDSVAHGGTSYFYKMIQDKRHVIEIAHEDTVVVVIEVRKRGFELISEENDESLIPKRETEHAAGYDFKASETVTIQPGEIKLVGTGIKSYMSEGEVLFLFDRSSNPRKKGIVLINSVGVIDGDYYNNPSNEGHIMGQFQNITNKPVTIERGERMMQGVFVPFLKVDNDNATGQRTGGFGSTN